MARQDRVNERYAQLAQDIVWSDVPPVATHIQTQQPSPGAMSYAYTTYALPPQTPIGAGVSVHHIPRPTQPQQVYAMQSVPTSGIPTRAGSVWHQGLWDENTGTLGVGMPNGPTFNTPQFA